MIGREKAKLFQESLCETVDGGSLGFWAGLNCSSGHGNEWNSGNGISIGINMNPVTGNVKLHM